MYFEITFDLDIFYNLSRYRKQKKEIKEYRKAVNGFIFTQREKGGLVYISINLNIKSVKAC